jgi:hypothetical protein
MKLILTSIENGYLQHTEVELPERFLDLSIELETGPIFQVNVSDDEQVLNLREKTYRSLAFFPESANSVTIKGL